MEKAAVSNVLLEIEKGLVGYREWSWDKLFAAWKQAAVKGHVKTHQVEVIDGVSYNVGQWQDAQRCKKARLSVDRIQKMEAAGFVWSVRATPHTWEESLTAWKLAAVMGPVSKNHVKVVDSVLFQVGRWQSIQRTNKNKLNASRLQQLEEAGFLWSVRKNKAHTWEESLTAWKLAAAKGPVSKNHVQVIDGVSYPAGRWQDTQRSSQASLSTDKQQKLEVAGFVWTVMTTKAQKHTWEESFTAWKQAAKKGTVTHRQVEVIDGIKYNIGTWQDRQCTNKMKLNDDKKQKLKAAGFVWSVR
jgi:hypothetical protein